MSSNSFNKCRTMDRFPEQWPPPHESERRYKYRKRFSLKTRTRLLEHEPPEKMKQYVLKPWTSRDQSDSKPPKKKQRKERKKLRALDKRRLVEAMQSVLLFGPFEWISGFECYSNRTRIWLIRIKSNRSTGGYRSEDRKGFKGYKARTSTILIQEMVDHIRYIQDDDFDPSLYQERDYVLRGSIRTDGFLLQLIAFKLKELNAVKYKRLPEEKLPSRLTSTLGGTGDFLTEIRNVEGCARPLGNGARQIKILGLDLGQAFIAGASALLPDSLKTDKGKGIDTSIRKPTDKDTKSHSATRFYNLAISQKAAYQPTLRHRHWQEWKKAKTVYDTMSVTGIESSLPSLRGDNASVKDYVARLEEVEAHLGSFYNDSKTWKKNKWDAGKARSEEYGHMVNSPLKIIGGTIGEIQKDENKMINGIGLGKFQSSRGLSSLHESFKSYFVRTMPELRRIRLPGRHKEALLQEVHHRDVMAGHNIANAVRGQLINQQRPSYLQPQDEAGNFLWMVQKVPLMDASSSGSGSQGHKRQPMTEGSEPKRVQID
ncbi:hypothetical protein BX616_003919 [Lobosporangium transversale]|nr:hypothetical protein BX616_003919 [Lobosporangium transversale]